MGLLCILILKHLCLLQVWKRSGAWFYKGLPKYILPPKTPGLADDPHFRPQPMEPTEQEPRNTDTSRVYTWARGRRKFPGFFPWKKLTAISRTMPWAPHQYPPHALEMVIHPRKYSMGCRTFPGGHITLTHRFRGGGITKEFC